MSRIGLLIPMLSCAYFAASLQADPPKNATTQPAVRYSRVDEMRDYVNEMETESRSLQRLAADETERARRDTGRIEVSAEALHQAAAKLDEQLFNLQLEDYSAHARKNAILKELDKLKGAATQTSNDDEVIRQLQAVVASRQSEYDHCVQQMQAGLNNQTQTEVDKTAADLALAKAQLAVQRQQSAASQGADMIPVLRKQLIELTIDQEDREVRRQFLEEQSAKLAKGLSDIAPIEQAEVEIASLRKNIAETKMMLLGAKQ